MDVRNRMPATWALVACMACAACGNSDRPRAESQPGSAAPPVAPAQTPKQAMELACGGFEASGAAQRPAEQQAQVMFAWLRTQVTNPVILAELDDLALDTWASAREHLAELARVHGVEPCALAQNFSKELLPIELPRLVGPGLPDRGGGLVVVSQDAITVDGATVVALDHGRLNPSEISAHVIKPLAKVVIGATTDPVRIAFDRRTPVATALAAIATVSAGGQAKVLIICDQNHEHVVLPVWTALTSHDVKYVVTASRATLQLARWENGKPGKPLVDAPLDGGMGQILRAIVLENAKTPPPPGMVSPVLLVLDPTLDVDRLVALAGSLGSLMTSVVLSPAPA